MGPRNAGLALGVVAIPTLSSWTAGAGVARSAAARTRTTSSTRMGIMHSSSSSRLVVLLQDTLEGLARDVSRESVDDHHVAHTLELRADARVEPRSELGRCDGAALAQEHRGHRRLTPAGIRGPEDGDLHHGRVLDGHLLDVAGVDVHATRDDHVLFPIDQEQVAVLIDVPEIAGMQPPVDDRPGGEVRTLVVAGHHERPPAEDLADMSRRHVAAVVVKDAHLVERD